MRRLAPLAVLAALLLAPMSARASIFGEENAALSEIAVTVGAQLGEAVEYVKQFQEYYKEFKEYAGYAKDAVDAFEAARNFNFSTLSAEDLLDEAFPDAARVQRDLKRGDWWQADPGMRRAARLCFSEVINGKKSGNRCHEFEDKADAQQIRDNLDKTFGTKAVTLATAAARDSAARAIAIGDNARSRSEATRTFAVHALDDTCAGAKDPSACQAAANIASIRTLDELTRVNDQLAEANRLQAIRVQQEAARRERDLQESNSQLQLAIDSSKRAFQPPPTVEVTEGVDLLGSSKLSLPPSLGPSR